MRARVVETPFDRFEQGGLASAVLPDDGHHRLFARTEDVRPGVLLVVFDLDFDQPHQASSFPISAATNACAALQLGQSDFGQPGRKGWIVVSPGKLGFHEEREELLQVDGGHIDPFAAKSGQHIAGAAHLHDPDTIGGLLAHDLFDLPPDRSRHAEDDRHRHRIGLVLFLQPFENRGRDLDRVFFVGLSRPSRQRSIGRAGVAIVSIRGSVPRSPSSTIR